MATKKSLEIKSSLSTVYGKNDLQRKRCFSSDKYDSDSFISLNCVSDDQNNSVKKIKVEENFNLSKNNKNNKKCVKNGKILKNCAKNNKNIAKNDENCVKDENAMSNYKIPSKIRSALYRQSIHTLFEIQHKSFNFIYNGEDFVGRARTGQGKTLAFVLPIASKIIHGRREGKYRSKSRSPIVLVLTPVRELAAQVAKVFEESCDGEISVCTVFGGVSYEKQEKNLNKGADVVVGTCGRVMDLLKKDYFDLENIKFVVLDEMDEMLDIGFAEDVEEILSQTKSRSGHQTLLFSATMPDWVVKMARKYLNPNYKQIDLVGNKTLQTSHTLDHYAICAQFSNRNAILAAFLQGPLAHSDRVIIFADRKADCNALAQGPLAKHSCRVLHGDIPQKQRSETIEAFRKGDFRLLVATDVAARGINVPGVGCVVQLDPPSSHEIYVHRSGRTGRAGAAGKAILFYTPKNAASVASIEKKAKIAFNRVGAPLLRERLAISLKKLQNCAENARSNLRKVVRDEMDGLLKGFSAENAILAALSLLVGENDDFANRSMLSGAKGFVTLCFIAENIRDRYDVLNGCKEFLNEDFARNIKNITLFKDKKGAAFDIAENLVEKTEKFQKPKFSKTLHCDAQIKSLSILPQLNSFEISNFDRHFSRNFSRNNGRKNNSRKDRNFNRKNGRNVGRKNNRKSCGNGRNNKRRNYNRN